MNYITNTLAGLLCVAASGVSFAQGKKVDTIPVRDSDKADAINAPSLLSYTFANLGYARTEYDGDADLKADGFGVSGSFQLPANLVPMLPSLYATAAYATSETDEVFGGTVDITEYRAGLGYRLGLSKAFDLNAEVDYLRTELEGKGSFAGEEDSGSGFRLGLGGRFMVLPQIETGGAVRYVDDGDDTATVFEVNGLYHIAHGFAGFVNAATSSDYTTYGIGGRYTFGF